MPITGRMIEENEGYAVAPSVAPPRPPSPPPAPLRPPTAPPTGTGGSTGTGAGASGGGGSQPSDEPGTTSSPNPYYQQIQEMWEYFGDDQSEREQTSANGRLA